MRKGQEILLEKARKSIFEKETGEVVGGHSVREAYSTVVSA